MMAEGQYLVGLPVGVHIAENGEVTLTVYAEDLGTALAEDDAATPEHIAAAEAYLDRVGTALTAYVPITTTTANPKE